MTLFENFFQPKGGIRNLWSRENRGELRKGRTEERSAGQTEKIWGQAQMSLLTNRWGEARPRVEVLGEQVHARAGRRGLPRGGSGVEAVGALARAARGEAGRWCSAPILVPSSFSKRTSGSSAQCQSTHPKYWPNNQSSFSVRALVWIRAGCLLLQLCARWQKKKQRKLCCRTFILTEGRHPPSPCMFLYFRLPFLMSKHLAIKSHLKHTNKFVWENQPPKCSNSVALQTWGGLSDQCLCRLY